MKSFIIWLLGTLFGAAVGYGISILADMNELLFISIGVILGSTSAITYNIHREKDISLDELEVEQQTKGVDPDL